MKTFTIKWNLLYKIGFVITVLYILSYFILAYYVPNYWKIIPIILGIFTLIVELDPKDGNLRKSFKHTIIISIK